MERAVSADVNLLYLKDLTEVLSRAAAGLGPEAEHVTESLLNSPTFDATFTDLLQDQMSDAEFFYTGDLPEGEAYGGKLVSVEEVGDWSVVGLGDTRVSVILDAKVKVRVDVQFEDRESAIYDREDDRWFGAESAAVEIDDDADIQILVELDRSTGRAVGVKMLTTEINVSDSSDYDYC